MHFWDKLKQAIFGPFCPHCKSQKLVYRDAMSYPFGMEVNTEIVWCSECGWAKIISSRIRWYKLPHYKKKRRH